MKWHHYASHQQRTWRGLELLQKYKIVANCVRINGRRVPVESAAETAIKFQPWPANSLNGNAGIESEPAQPKSKSKVKLNFGLNPDFSVQWITERKAKSKVSDPLIGQWEWFFSDVHFVLTLQTVYYSISWPACVQFTVCWRCSEGHNTFIYSEELYPKSHIVPCQYSLLSVMWSL